MDRTLYNFYKDKRPETPAAAESSVYVINLTKDMFVIDTPGISFKIIDDMGFQKGHYMLSSIVSFDLDKNKITIKTSDEIEIVYFFVTELDAEITNNKINDFLNGV